MSSSYTSYTYRRIINIFIFYFIWISLHYIASHLYVHFCVPTGIYGFFSSFFLIQMPHCSAIRYMINFGSEQITHMWVFVGTFLISLMTLLKVE